MRYVDHLIALAERYRDAELTMPADLMEALAEEGIDPETLETY